jgi:RNA polymerase sigma factor (sigma-70 family)
MARERKSTPEEIQLGKAMVVFANSNKNSPCAREAFDEINRLARPLLTSSLSRKGIPPAQIEDYIQNTFLAVWNKLQDSVRNNFNERSGRAWLYKTASREARRERCLKRTYLMTSAPSDNTGDDKWFWDSVVDEKFETPDINAQSHERAALALEAVEQINRTYSSALILYEFEDMRYHEIADHLKIKIGTVKFRIAKARGEIAQYMLSNPAALECL